MSATRSLVVSFISLGEYFRGNLQFTAREALELDRLILGIRTVADFYVVYLPNPKMGLTILLPSTPTKTPKQEVESAPPKSTQ
jgi:hypothetical protein